MSLVPFHYTWKVYGGEYAVVDKLRKSTRHTNLSHITIRGRVWGNETSLGGWLISLFFSIIRACGLFKSSSLN